MSLPLPTHKHIPGQNARHPEDAFDWIRDQAATEAGNAAWLYGLRLLREGFYWEAHEVLEPVWMAAAPNSAEKAIAQAVIQLANAALKLDMGKPKAAVRLAGMVEALASDAARGGKSVLGVEVAVVSNAADSIKTGQPDLGGIGDHSSGT
ncbi:MAG: DUF309 domain-containing protein [Paracoccaceae bacterium]|nr:DUF309 domain-containing protein [Paracoccaceae bacterium]